MLSLVSGKNLDYVYGYWFHVLSYQAILTASEQSDHPSL